MLGDPSSPQPSLEGLLYKPSSAMMTPIVNSIEYAKDANVVPDYSKQESQPVEVESNSPNWLNMLRTAYEASDSWMKINLRSEFSQNLRHFHSEHSENSPILAESNKHRAQYFWPKSRTLVRDIQASATAAFFASSDVVAIEAEDQDNAAQCEAASFIKELVNYRLKNTLPWYQLLLGGIQEVAVLGTVVSHQSWQYREKEVMAGHEIDPVTGDIFGLFETKKILDRPDIRLVPIENLRISPASDWLDPINTSPYLIEMMPMFLVDVETRIREGAESKNGEPSWRDVGANMLIAAGARNDFDTTRRARTGTNKLDPKTEQIESVDQFKIIWIHRNIIRYNGEDWLFYSVGTMLLLSEPVLLSEVIPWADGKRDYVSGNIEVETDRVYPSSAVSLISGLQKGLNELKNQRIDNVRQVLNRRYLYRAGSQVDVRALSKNIPGGLIGISAPGALDSHVTPLATPDVTNSSYQEEDRINLAFDDLSGSMAGSTVNSNRRMNETVGGMEMMQSAGNKIREMELRTISKTWVERLLRQIVQLEAMYETDTVAMTVAAKKAKLLRVLPEYFAHTFSVSVNVGAGAVSPAQRMQRISTAISTVVQLVPDAAMAIQGEEIAKEVFGAAGFDNGDRFFDFAKVEAMKANPQADPELAIKQSQIDERAKADQAKIEIAQGKLQIENAKLQASLAEIEAKIKVLLSTATNNKVTSVYEATQAAGVILQNPGAAPVVDGLLASAGFVDENQPPVTVVPAGTPPVALAPGNTNPMHPKGPDTAGIGKQRGLITPTLSDGTV